MLLRKSQTNQTKWMEQKFCAWRDTFTLVIIPHSLFRNGRELFETLLWEGGREGKKKYDAE